MSDQETRKYWFSPYIPTLVKIIEFVFTVFGILISIEKVQNSPSPILLVLFIIVLFAFLVYIIYTLIKNPGIAFYAERSQAPKSYKTDSIIKKITRKRLNVTIVGRTNQSWFENIEKKKILYEKAIAKGCKIKFIIQHHGVINNTNDHETIKRIPGEREESIRLFKSIREYLINNNAENAGNFQMFLTQNPVNNSMTDVYDNKGYHFYFSYDIGLDPGKNPFLIFRKNSVLEEIKKLRFDSEDKSINLFEYEIKQAKGAIDTIIKKYSQFSELRDNHNKKLVYYYYKRKNFIEENKFFPPVSIQLLVTNKCTAKCVMCSHHSIGSTNELKLSEIENLLDYIVDVGTKNIIISGGEPLYREDCFQILEKANKKGLNTGLLTNGIKYGRKSLTLKDAKKLKNYCSWIQLSIDSFRSDTYKQIRGIDIDIVKQSLYNLEAVKANLEIAFTIQKLNIAEATGIIKSGITDFDTSALIRFKFAHGPDTGKKFLLSNKETKLKKFIDNCSGSDKYNAPYISAMFEDGYFNETDIIKGAPLYSKNKFFNDKKYKCHILNYSCKIDAEGNLFSCCFLYDDNAGNDSKIRNRYNLGTLRTDGRIVPLEKGNNTLKKLISEKVGCYGNYIIPIEQNACNNCTRHFYQNAFLNEIDAVNEKYKDINFLYPDTEALNDNDKIWI